MTAVSAALISPDEVVPVAGAVVAGAAADVTPGVVLVTDMAPSDFDKSSMSILIGEFGRETVAVFMVGTVSVLPDDEDDKDDGDPKLRR